MSEFFEGPFYNKNVNGGIIKYYPNTPLEKAFAMALERPTCHAFVYTDDRKLFLKTTSYETAMQHVESSNLMKGHTTYIKKPNHP